VLAFGLLSVGPTPAQTFKTLYNFSGGSDGATPYRALLLFSNTLYGTARSGGGFGAGTVFSLNSDGTDFTNVYSFSGGLDGAIPVASLLLLGRTLYGTTTAGGAYSNGTIFSVNTDGSEFQVLHTFMATIGGTNGDGQTPEGGLIVSGNTLYGTANYGGSSGQGTIFKVNTDGTGFATLYSFDGGDDGSYPNFNGPLIRSGNTLYGSTYSGGSSGNGTVFRINTDGTGFTNLHSLMTSEGGGSGALVLWGNVLYGTAYNGGRSGTGTIFSLNADGTGFRNLHSFTGGSDGGGPSGPLLMSGRILYGTGQGGGISGYGTVFAINMDGTGFTNLYSFTTPMSCCPSINPDGALPHAGLICTGTTLYGAAAFGGDFGYGTVFSIPLPPPPPELSITESAGAVVLTWPTNIAGLALQFATNLASATFWGAVSDLPVIYNGQYTVTNPISGTPRFYRLVPQATR
jgi:uncharacterized repeat protein (TIGR03803 family)